MNRNDRSALTVFCLLGVISFSADSTSYTVACIQVSFHQLLCSLSKRTSICYGISFTIKSIFFFWRVLISECKIFMYRKICLWRISISKLLHTTDYGSFYLSNTVLWKRLWIPAFYYILSNIGANIPTSFQSINTEDEKFSSKSLKIIYLAHCYTLSSPQLLVSYSLVFYVFRHPPVNNPNFKT